MADYEQFYEDNRTEIERMLEPLNRASQKLKRMSNRDLARELYRVALEEEHLSLVMCEAAERLAAVELTENIGDN